MKTKRSLARKGIDLMGNEYRPGDLIVTATSDAFRRPQIGLRLVVVEHIFLDDQHGNPYYRTPIYFRNPEGNFSDRPSDGQSQWEELEPVGDWEDYIRIVPKAKSYHSQYEGVDEIVGRFAYKISGHPIYPDGSPVGAKAIYGMDNILLIKKGYRDVN